ncbi:MAG: prepilin peptidase [Burkholderiales bacterium]|nr:prepilin peptidase [Anaerolineae bacterium]
MLEANAFNIIRFGLIGILIGGVLNVLADDLPHYRRPRLPHYPDSTLRPISAWFGLSAFLLGRRTSPSGTKLSWRYPLTELLSAVAMIVVLVNVVAEDPAMPPLHMYFLLFYMAVFVLITVIDIEHKLILFSVIIPSCIVALLDSVLTPTPYGPGLGDALLGGALGFGVFFLLYLGGYLFTYVMAKARGIELNEVAFGYGDVMLATLSGLILGWQPLIFAMFITIFVGAFGAFIYLVAVRVMGSRYTMFTALPYGPYIVIGTIIMLVFSEAVSVFLR